MKHKMRKYSLTVDAYKLEQYLALCNEFQWIVKGRFLSHAIRIMPADSPVLHEPVNNPAVCNIELELAARRRLEVLSHDSTHVGPAANAALIHASRLLRDIKASLS